MQGNPRADIAGAQAAFLDQLATVAAAGAFDARDVRVAGEALARKRMRSAAKAWPRVARELGERFAETFALYAREHPWPPAGGPSADGWVLACWLERSGRLGDEGAVELAACRLRARWNAGEQRLEFGKRFGVRRVRLGSGVLVIAVRLFGWEWWRRFGRDRADQVAAPESDGKTLASAISR